MLSLTQSPKSYFNTTGYQAVRSPVPVSHGCPARASSSAITSRSRVRCKTALTGIISIYSATQHFHHGSSLQQAVRSVQQQVEKGVGSSVVPKEVRVAATGQQLAVWKHPGIIVGAQDLVVAFEPPPSTASIMQQMWEKQRQTDQELAILRKETDQELAILRKTVVMHLPLRLRVVGGEILKLAATNQDLYLNPNTHWKQLSKDPEGMALIIGLSQHSGEDVHQIIKNADAVISRRIASVHFGSITDIDEEVRECLQLLNWYPELRPKCKWEAFAIDNWEYLKQHFLKK